LKCWNTPLKMQQRHWRQHLPRELHSLDTEPLIMPAVQINVAVGPWLDGRNTCKLATHFRKLFVKMPSTITPIKPHVHHGSWSITSIVRRVLVLNRTPSLNDYPDMFVSCEEASTREKEIIDTCIIT
jgi:hypothetical protein